MVGFFIGLLIGGFIGVSIMAVCNCAASADAQLKAKDDDCDFDSESYIDDENFDYHNQEQEGDF